MFENDQRLHGLFVWIKDAKDYLVFLWREGILSLIKDLGMPYRTHIKTRKGIMDIKDTQENISALNGQSIERHNENAIGDSIISVSVSVKKTEKIATAIYMVTDFILDSEPLKSQLRTLAVALMTNTQKLLSRSIDPHLMLPDEVIRIIDTTTAFLTLAATVGIISQMNGSILITELRKIRESIHREYTKRNTSLSTRHVGYTNVVLDPAMFAVEKDFEKEESHNKGQENNKGHILSTNVLYKKDHRNGGHEASFSKKIDIGNKIARRNDVLTIVRNKGKVSIKDISDILKDIGNKTIQRELFNLVQEGVLIKEGEKRWSMYRIAK